MPRGRMNEQRLPAVAGRAWFLLAAATLLVNDHALKARHPGWVTGKLSDVAGPAVVAGLLALLLPRTVAAATTAVAFTALKVVPGVAEVAAPLLGGVTARDATDLLGLLALVPTWHLLGARKGSAAAATGTPQWAPTQPRQALAVASPCGGSAAAAALVHLRRRILPIGGTLLAVVAVTATSAPRYDEVRSLVVSGPDVYAEIGPERRPVEDGDDDEVEWAVSDDGGRTWEEAEEPPGDDGTGSQAEVCRSDGSCFAGRGATIERRDPGGDWTTDHRFSDDQAEVLDYRRYGSGTPLRELFQEAVVVPATEGEFVVVVAADEGVAVLPPTGDWERVSVLDVAATPVGGAMWPLHASTILVLASGPLAFLLVLIAAVRRGGGGARVLGAIAGGALIAVPVWAIGVGAWAFGTFSAQNPVLLALGLLVLAVGVVLLPLAFVRRLGPPDEAPAPA